MEWYLKGLRQYADFKGRSRRREYWMFTLVSFVVALVLDVLDYVLGLMVNGFGILGLIYLVAVIVPSTAVSIRRLHDINRTGWWELLVLVPILGWLVLTVFAVIAGDQGSNRYGPDPKAAQDDGHAAPMLGSTY